MERSAGGAARIPAGSGETRGRGTLGYDRIETVSADWGDPAARRRIP
jgi:hypothetical protein